MMGISAMAIGNFGGINHVGHTGFGHGFMVKFLFIILLGRLGLHGVYALMGFIVILLFLLAVILIIVYRHKKTIKLV